MCTERSNHVDGLGRRIQEIGDRQGSRVSVERKRERQRGGGEGEGDNDPELATLRINCAIIEEDDAVCCSHAPLGFGIALDKINK
jgi:hypothetical protein